MGSKVHKKGKATPEMNMTPMIDVVFQLLIFFMLTNQIVAEESVEMIVPKLDDPKTVELGRENRVTVNLIPADYLPKRNPGDLAGVSGHVAMVKIGLSQFKPSDHQAITAAMREVKARNKDIEVLLRADAATYYDEIQPVLQAIASANITKVNLVAYMPEE